MIFSKNQMFLGGISFAGLFYLAQSGTNCHSLARKGAVEYGRHKENRTIGGDALCMAKRMPKTLDTSTRQKRLLDLLEDYIKSCRPPPEADTKKASGRLANLAGFCRFIGCGISHLQKLCSEVPRLYDLICTTLEDELLISSPSPSLLSYYLKKRLGYDEKGESAAASCGEMRLVFEHDILEDGA